MSGMMENVSTVNSFLRTLIALVVLGGAGTAGWYGYTTFNAKDIEAKAKAKELADATQKLTQVQQDLDAAAAELVQKDATIQEQQANIAQLNVEVDKLEVKLALHKVDHRLARLTATDQGKDPTTKEPYTLVEFVELNDEGQPIDTPREFRIRGDEVYIDGWVVKFDDKYIEEQDLERGTAIYHFRRIFGDRQQPIDGFPLDEVGQTPRAYARGGKMSDFEKEIFGDFWEIANDIDRAEGLGIRAIQGKADYMKVQKGKSYTVTLRPTGDVSIVPEVPAER